MKTIEKVEALVTQKKYDAAEALCKKLKKAGVRDVRLDFLSGSIPFLKGDYGTALKIFSGLRRQYPNHPGVLNNLGNLLLQTGGDIEEAQSLIERSLDIAPDNAPALVALGELYQQRRRTSEAARLYERLVKLAPENPQGYYGLGVCARDVNDFKKAEEWLDEAEKRAPFHPKIIFSLLQAATQNKNHDKAFRLANRIADTPELSTSLCLAWAILKRYCQWGKADALLPRVVEALQSPSIQPQHFSPIALEILSSDKISHDTLKRLHVQCGEGLAQNNRVFGTPDKSKAFQPASRMRIGYLSGDFRNHVVSLFIKGIVNHHDASAFEIFLYSNAPVGYRDETSSKFFRVAEHFIDCAGMDDGELARRIAADGIHVLIDLSGFTTYTRLTVLTLRPAPVQISYIGYPATYGMKEVDYILSNKEITGSDHASAFIEAPLELPRIYAINPPPLYVHRSATLPCKERGFITFGSLVNCYKINRSTVALWSKVLRAVPESRIYLNHPVYACAATRTTLEDAFAEEGIARYRVTVTDERPEDNGPHFLLYDNIDIVLDATPMTGGAGTSDALTVGVPIVSRLGTVFHERLSAAAICANAPDPEIMLSESDEGFVEKAVALANNPQLLETLRHQIRHNVLFGQNSEAEQFTRELEACYRKAWDQRYPTIPIDSICHWEAPTEEIQLSGYRLRLSAIRNDLHRYVARETGVWFEPECAFVARHAAIFNEIWDVSDDPGLAVLPIALGSSGDRTLRCLRFARKGRVLLAENCALNQLQDRCRVVESLDQLSGSPLLIRLGAERNDGNARLLRGILERCENLPLMLLVATDGVNGPDFSAAKYLSGIGYAAYRLHIGCDLLVPYVNAKGTIEEVSSGFSSDAEAPRNLFFVIPEAAALLEEHGLLCKEALTPENLPPADHMGWQAIACLPRESGGVTDLKWHDVYLSALNAYAFSQDKSLTAAQRLGYFNFALAVSLQLTDVEPTVARVFSAIRMTQESGSTDRALMLARTLADQLQGKHGQVFAEPFVLPHVALDGMTPAENEALWAQSLTLVAIEKMRRWSSFFTAAESLLLWNALATSCPWWKKEAEKMLQVLRQIWETEASPEAKTQSSEPESL